MEQVAAIDKTDKSLIAAHRGGDTTAFAEIVRRYGKELLGYLVRISGGYDNAEDIFQETFKRVHEKGHTFKGGSFKSWLFTIATRLAIDAGRKNKRLKFVSLNSRLDPNDEGGPELSDVAVIDKSADPCETVERDERIAQVRQAINTLPVKQRATLVLAYYQQLSYSEVAAIQGCSVGTVKTQMFRAMKTLAGRLPDISGGVK